MARPQPPWPRGRDRAHPRPPKAEAHRAPPPCAPGGAVCLGAAHAPRARTIPSCDGNLSRDSLSMYVCMYVCMYFF